jgi:hypothetical protein
VILGLATEVAFRVDRALQGRTAARYAAANPSLYTTRDAVEACDTCLWLEREVDYRPGAELHVEVGGVRYTVTINSLGYRDREVTVAKPPGTVRVICLGGSTTVAGVTNDQTYPAQLERALLARPGARPVQVLNFGKNSLESDFWTAPRRLAELLRFEPDVVVQYEGVNDVAFRYLGPWGAAHPWRAPICRSVAAQAALARFAPMDLDEQIDGTLQNLRTIRDALRRRGAAYVLGSFAAPDPARLGPDQRAFLDQTTRGWTDAPGVPPFYGYEQYHGSLQQYNARLVGMARAEGIALAPIAERISDPALFVDICHLTPEGITALSRAFLPEVAAAVDHREGP